jgi:hypothetical protein
MFLAAETGVIPGHEEALYGFMAVAVAMSESGTVDGSGEGSGVDVGMGVRLGVLDLGGASKQLSYVLDPAVMAAEEVVEVEVEVEVAGDALSTPSGGRAGGRTLRTVCLPDYVVQLPGSSQGAPTAVVARSIPGLGLLAAMDTILDLHPYAPLLSSILPTTSEQTESESETDGGKEGDVVMGEYKAVPHPCLSVGEHLKGEC